MRGAFVAGLAVLLLACAIPGISGALVVDFTDGTAYLAGGGTFDPSAGLGYAGNVDYYVEDGVLVDFIGGTGIIGEYYLSRTTVSGLYENDVIHTHWGFEEEGLSAIVFSMLDNSALDLNYLDITSNTNVAGGQSTGSEVSYLTASNGATALLPSSDWGLDVDAFYGPGDGVARLWLDSSFDGITSFTVTSETAYCFGMDNFYINEPPPPSTVPEPGSLLLIGSGMAALAGFRRRRRG